MEAEPKTKADAMDGGMETGAGTEGDVRRVKFEV